MKKEAPSLKISAHSYRRIFSVQVILEHIRKVNGGYADEKPKRRKQRADLPEKVKFLLRVIPYTHMKSAVDYAADAEFKRCNDSAACEATKKQASVFHIYVDNMNQQKGKTAC